MTGEEFGVAVRRWRNRVSPESVGLPVGARRRATGLRREELAHLAGVSVDYLTRLEQGRATSPSAQVVEALARGLRLSDLERQLLFRLAGHTPPGRQLVSQRIPPSVQRLLDRLTTTPVVVYDALWELLDANAPYDALTDASTWRGIERNALWRNLAGPGPAARHTPVQLAQQQQGLVADLRMSAAKYPADPRVRQLVAELRRQSPRFAELWDAAVLPAPQDPSRQKVFDHPEVGPIALDCDTLVVTGDDLRIMIYTAQPGTDDAERLGLVSGLGTQNSTP